MTDAAELTTDEVLARLHDLGRVIARSTWEAAVSRGWAPKPVRHVGRTPLYAAADVDLYGRYEWRPTTG